VGLGHLAQIIKGATMRSELASLINQCLLYLYLAEDAILTYNKMGAVRIRVSKLRTKMWTLKQGKDQWREAEIK